MLKYISRKKTDDLNLIGEFESLNKIIFHLDTGYSNDGELKEIETK